MKSVTLPILLLCASATSTAQERESSPIPSALQQAVQATLLEDAYRVTPATCAPGSWTAANPSRGLRATFSLEGLEVSPQTDGGDACALTLELEAWGRGEATVPVAPGACRGTGSGIEIERGAITEWYRNDERGLEQGFTLAAPPELASADREQPLGLVLAVGGGFAIDVLPGGRDAHFTSADGGVKVSYSGLRAWDARQRELSTHLERRGDRLAVVVEDLDAVYPVTIDPWVWLERAQLTASDAAPIDAFGYSVSLSDDTALIGAPGDDEAGESTGAAYVFVRDGGGSRSQQAKLIASDAAATSHFGYSVSLFGDTALIGAPVANEVRGCAYVFTRDHGGNWSQQAILVGADTGINDCFGVAVSLMGDRALIGAYTDGDSGTFSGSAYVFDRSGTSWSQQAKLLASDGAAGDNFGFSVCLFEEKALIGAPSHAPSGSAYVFARNTLGFWVQVASLQSSDGTSGDGFGSAVSLHGTTALIGARFDDDNGTDSGSAYVFEYSHSNWVEQAKLVAGHPNTSAGFGCSVSVSEDLALVGAAREDARAIRDGAAYSFVRSGIRWRPQAKLIASDIFPSAYFGTSVCIGDGVALVGASQNLGGGAGAAYVFGGSNTLCTIADIESGSVYHLLEHSSWSAAEAAACALGGHLATINDAQESAWVISHFAEYPPGTDNDLVIGLHDSITEGVFEWTSGEPVTFTDWATGEPNDYGSGEDYVRIKHAAGMLWNDYDGTDGPERHGVVEIPLPTVLHHAVNPDSGHTYYLLEHSSWTEAEAMAVALGGHLATIDDETENDWVIATFGSYPAGTSNDLIIGLHDSIVEGTFQWTSGEPVGFTDWGSGQPDDFGSGEDYVRIKQASGMTWNDYAGDDAWDRHGVVEVPTEPGVGYCFGDPGSGTPCPCDNDNDGSVPGSGCASGVNPAGARLSGRGVASISADTLVLTTTGLEPNNAGLYFQANNLVQSGNGSVFGDGLRCAGGGLIRLQVRFSDAAGSSSTTIAIGVKGAVTAGATKRYQCWYRTQQSPPCGLGVNDFNLSNGYQVAWLP